MARGGNTESARIARARRRTLAAREQAEGAAGPSRLAARGQPDAAQIDAAAPLDATALLPAQSLIAGCHDHEQAAFEHLRARMLEAETQPELAAAILALRWDDLHAQLIARLHATQPADDDRPR